jgi:streptomycin 6-kinase
VVLRAWAGRGAVRVIDECAGDWALLLERVRPGTPLSAEAGPPRAQLLVATSVLRSLTSGVVSLVGLDDVPTMAAVGRRWAELMSDRAARAVAAGELDPDMGLVSAAVGLMRDLPGSADRQVVVHGDFNPGNVLRTADGGWVAIDPKSMVGDLAYDLWPLLEQVGDPFRGACPVGQLAERTALVAGELGLDPARIAAWGLARTVESALWLWAESGDEAGARDGFARAAIWADVAP